MWQRYDGELMVHQRYFLYQLRFLTQIGALPARLNPAPAAPVGRARGGTGA